MCLPREAARYVRYAATSGSGIPAQAMIVASSSQIRPSSGHDHETA
jgi:hypothetical protein